MKMIKITISFLILFDLVKDNATTFNGNITQKILSRKRRYVAFPEGSSISASLCTTIGAIGNPNVDFLSYALNWGVAYDLPNKTWVIQSANGFKKNENSKAEPIISKKNMIETKAEVQRRHRRDLYNKIEIAIDSMGFSGRDCILRTLCESSQYFFESRRGNMIEELIKAIFSFPINKVLSREHRDIHQYGNAYRRGFKPSMKENIDCSSTYPNCHFSLLELALGKYSQPTPDDLSIYKFM